MIRASALLFVFVAACSSSSSPDPGRPSDVSDDRSPAPAPKPIGESQPSEQRPKDPSTTLTVGIDSEPFASQGMPLERLDVVVKVDGLVAAELHPTSDAGPLFPREVRVAAPEAKPDASVDIEVAGVEVSSPIVTRKITTRFVPNAHKLAYVYLELRCADVNLLGGTGPSGPTCDASQTCVGGVCVDPSVAPTDLPDDRADWATSPPSACGDATSATLAPGSGQTTYTPLADGDTVTLEQGPQCGHHVWLAFEMNDLSQFKTITTMSGAVPGSSITIQPTAVPYAWSRTPSGKCALSGVRFQVDAGGVKVADLLGKPFDLTVSAKDDRGRSASVTRHLQIASTYANPSGRTCN